MTCTECQSTIADKAIVCYRCGAPTAIPATDARPASSPRRKASPVAAVVVLLMAMLAGLLGAIAEPDTYMRLGSIVAAVVLTIGSVVLFVRR